MATGSRAIASLRSAGDHFVGHPGHRLLRLLATSHFGGSHRLGLLKLFGNGNTTRFRPSTPRISVSDSQAASAPARRTEPALFFDTTVTPDIATTGEALCCDEPICEIAMRAFASQEVGQQDGGARSVGHAAREDNAAL